MGEDRVVLQPAKLCRDRFVVDRKAAAVVCDWKVLLEKLAPQGTPEGVRLRSLQPGFFVGLSRSAYTGKLVNFMFFNPDRSGDLSAVLKRDPSFKTRVVEVYRVEEVQWAGRIAEGVANPAP